jgi:hypothetical protein
MELGCDEPELRTDDPEFGGAGTEFRTGKSQFPTAGPKFRWARSEFRSLLPESRNGQPQLPGGCSKLPADGRNCRSTNALRWQTSHSPSSRHDPPERQPDTGGAGRSGGIWVVTSQRASRYTRSSSRSTSAGPAQRAAGLSGKQVGGWNGATRNAALAWGPRERRVAQVRIPLPGPRRPAGR